MVRVVSQSFNHPRSRHSSGETDLELALRADSALSSLRAKRSDILDCESSSDSFWDSEFDTDQQDHQFCYKESGDDEINGNETSEKSDVFTKRKERRRERNKVSAQAYRQRRRQVTVSTQQELSLLEEKNKRLWKEVHELEQKTEHAKQFIKGQRVSVPDFLCPDKTKNTHFSTTNSSSISCEPQKINAAASDQSLSSPCPSLKTSVNSNLNWNLGNFSQNDHQNPNGNICPVNANFPKTTPVNLNSLGGIVTSSSDLSNSPSVSPAAGLSAAKHRQSLFNANHNYKLPIHHPKALRTVHEIPPVSNITNDEVESNHLTFSNHGCVRDSSEINCGAKANCDEFSIHKNGNMNLNMNERMKNNIFCTEDKIWNGSIHMHQFKFVNMNDNENANLSNPQLQNNLHSNNVVQLIITAGDNTMPSSQ